MPLRSMLRSGGVPGSTATLKVQVFVLPATSVAVTVTVFVPSAKAEPDGGFATALESAQLSLPDTTKVTTAEQPLVAVTVMFDEQIAAHSSIRRALTSAALWITVIAGASGKH